MSEGKPVMDLELGIEGLDELERLIESARGHLTDAEAALERAREVRLSIVASSAGGSLVRIGGIEQDSSAS